MRKYIIVTSVALITALNFNLVFPVCYLYSEYKASASEPLITESTPQKDVQLDSPKEISPKVEIPGLHFVATAYTAAEDECGKPVGHPDYGRTASGEMVRRGIVAVDTDVIPMHSLIKIEGAGELSGVYEVKDTGGAIKGNRIDIYVPTKHEAFKFGRRDIKVYILREGK